MPVAVETWPEYVRQVAAGLTQAQIATRTGNQVSQSNVGRWLRGELSMPAADNVVAFARAFGRSPVEALTAAGYLQPGEADAATPVRMPLSAYGTDELFDELRRRTKRG